MNDRDKKKYKREAEQLIRAGRVKCPCGCAAVPDADTLAFELWLGDRAKR